MKAYMRQLLVGALVGCLVSLITMASPRLWQLARWAPGSALGQQSSAPRWAATSACRSPERLGKNTPTTVLVHGSTAASRRGTGVTEAERRACPRLRISAATRGPLGDPETFSTRRSRGRDPRRQGPARRSETDPGATAWAAAWPWPWPRSPRGRRRTLAAVVVEDCRNRRSGPAAPGDRGDRRVTRIRGEKDAVAPREALRGRPRPAGSGRGSGRSPAAATGAT